MKKLFSAWMPLFVTGFFFSPTLFSQDASSSNCTGYPADETCCLKNRGAMVTDQNGDFCYLNLLTSRATKAQCLDAGGYTYWKNDSTILCLPKGVSVLTGDVSAVDENAKTIIISADGTTYTILGSSMMLPKSGERIDIYYTTDPEGIMYGKTCHPSLP